jgi:uncharacterized protein DUF6988
MYQVSEYSKNLEGRIANAINGARIPADDRSQVAGALFDIVHEHHRAVLILIGQRLYGSAGALLRSLFESYVRGVWFMKCACVRDVERFQEDRFKEGSFEERLKEIEKVDGDAHGGLLKLKDKGWGALNSYTHGGFRPVGRRFKGIQLMANYSESEILEVERMANAFAVLAVFQIAEMGNNTALSGEAEKLAAEFIDHSHNTSAGLGV